MGLAERFKEKLSNKNIFIENKIEEKLQEKEIMFISKPITETEVELENNEELQQEEVSDIIEQEEVKAEEVVIEPIKNVLAEETKPTINITRFEDLESELICKIRKTPYWEEYSIQRQEKMISSYFTKKVQDFSTEEKKEFVKNILALANNR